MAEPEYRRVQAYILEADRFSDREQPYALAWLAYIYVYPDKPDGKRPLPAAFGINADWADDLAECVESLVEEMRVPGFDQDDPQTL
jgi:hypothetical protein